MTTISHDNDNKTLSVPVACLIHLKEAGFSLPEHATREIDSEHVFNLSETDSTLWPSIEVVETDKGIAVIDGNHRWQALVRQVALEVLGLSEASKKEQDTALGRVTAAQRDQIDTLLDETLIPAHFGVYRTDRDVAKAALTANLKHGLPPKSKALVHIAVELYDITRGEDPEPSQAEIARMVGIARATLNEYLKKREKEAEKATQEAEVEEVASEKQQKEKSEAEKWLKKADKFIADLQGMYEEDTETYNAIIKKLFPVVIVATHDMNAEVDETTYGENLREMFQVAPDVDASQLFYVRKFSSALTQWMKHSAAKAKKALTKKDKGTEKSSTYTPTDAQGKDHSFMDDYTR